MRLIDTSAWIEWFTDSPLAGDLAGEIPSQQDCLVPTMVQHELRKWFLRERGEDVADQVIAFTELCVVVPLDTRLALEAADVARQHKLATADAIIYASALAAGAELVTCDAHFTGLPDVMLFPKAVIESRFPIFGSSTIPEISVPGFTGSDFRSPRVFLRACRHK